MRKHPQIVIGVLLIALFICIAITAPLLAPNDPNATNLALKNAPPSAEYPLGCDQMGRCELSRLAFLGGFLDQQRPGAFRLMIGQRRLPIAGSDASGLLRPFRMPRTQIHKRRVRRQQV